MTILTLMTHLRRLGVELRSDGTQLRVKGATEHLTPELKVQLKERKEEILAFLDQARGMRTVRSSSIPRVARDFPLPLSFAQQRLWFIHEHVPGQEDAYNIPLALRLLGPLSLDALSHAFNALVARHESLRTTFALPEDFDASQPMQVIAAEQVFDLPVVPCAEDDIVRHAAIHARQVFDLARGPLLKATVLQLGHQDHVLLINMHHIITDGWSLSVMTRDLQHYYESHVAGEDAALPALPIQYADYACWQRQQDLDAHLDYWTSALTGYEEGLALPYDHARDAHVLGAAGVLHFSYPSQLSQQVAEYSQSQRATLFMTLLASMLIVLHRYTRRTDLCIGTTTAGRDASELEGLIGFFINILPLRVDLSGNPSAAVLLQRVKEVALHAFEHQALPFEHLLSVLPSQRDPSSGSLVPIMLRHQNFPEAQLSSWTDDVEITQLPDVEQAAKCELDFQFFGDGAALEVMVEYAADLFEKETVERLLQHHQDVLKQWMADPERVLEEFTVLTTTERQLFLQWNQTERIFDHSLSVQQLFEHQASTTPDAIAAYDDHGQLTYAALNVRANQIAHALCTRGVGPGSRVALCMERCVDFLAGLLGIFKAGGVYVPLDPRYPASYLQLILQDARPQWIITHSNDQDDFIGSDIPLLCLNDLMLNAQPQSDPPSLLTPGHVAYIAYTSGSTGQPKGVMVPHRQILNWLHALWQRMPFGADEVVAQKTTCVFVVSVKELLAGLLTGASQVLIPDAAVKDARVFIDTLRRCKVTRLNIVPSHLQTLLDVLGANCEALKSLRYCITAGEPLTHALQAEVRAKLPWVHLWNNYGCTELNDITYCAPDDHEGSGVFVPTGRPIANTRIHVLDEQMNQVPIGVMGELCVQSIGAAYGYWQQPELTAERFIPDPFDDTPGARLYKTGDMVRRMADGALEYLGRKDFEIKIRGHRIDVRQVEKALNEHAEISHAVAMSWSEGGNVAQLVAYYVPVQDSTFASSELRSYLSERLPAYMVPSLYVALDALPRLPNGKLDRLNLPSPEKSTASAHHLPSTPMEKILAEIWKDVLKLNQVGIHDNFFDIGGTSLLTVRIQSRLKEMLGREIAAIYLFQYPTVASLAQYLSQSQGEQATFMKIADRIKKSRAPGRQNPTGIAVIGMSGRFPGAENVHQFWDNLRNGVESIHMFSDEELEANGIDASVLKQEGYVKARPMLDNIELFDAEFFGYSPREAAMTDPQHRLFLECAWQALENAGYDPLQYQGWIGVYGGSGEPTYLLHHFEAITGAIDGSGATSVAIGNAPDYLTTRVSYKLNLQGPGLTVQTACSTSLVAIHTACQSLLSHQCDMALAGGVSIDCSQTEGYLYSEGGIVSPDGHCRAFDKDAQGTVFGDGLGIVVLKRLDEAISDGDTIYAVIRGSAVNNDGAVKIGYTAPSIDGQAQAIVLAQNSADIAPSTIGYVEAHGTGTSIGDPIEIAALTKAFRIETQEKQFCAIGSVKTNIGHANAAAGVAGLIKTALALHHRQIPPSLHFQHPNPQIDFANSPFYVNTTLSDWKREHDMPLRAAVSSFGIGGTNAHAVLEEAPPHTPSASSQAWQLLTISAKTETALEAATINLAEHLQQHPDLDLADASHTLQLGRRAFSHRRTVVCRDLAHAASILQTRDPARTATGFQDRADQPVAFLFPGQGAQYADMGWGLYCDEAVFREHVDHCSALLLPLLGLDLRDVIYPDRQQTDSKPPASDEISLSQTWLTQPALFVIEYAMARLWQAWGVHPQAIIGHSIGEYVAACLAEVLTLNEALALVAARGRLMQKMSAGAMLAVSLPERELLSMMGEELSLAAVNGPARCVVSGPEKMIDAFNEELVSKGIMARRLITSHAFHSSMMEPMLAPFIEEVKKVELKPPRIPFLSNLTGTWITSEQAVSPEYWAQQLRRTVRFADGVSELLRKSDLVLLEVGPGKTLGTLARQDLNGSGDRIILSSLRHPQFVDISDREFLLDNLAQLWLAGVPINWSNFHAARQRRRIPLPTYPFERRRYWMESDANRETVNENTRSENVADWFYFPAWKRSLVPVLHDTTAQSDCWLIFSDGCGLSERLASRLAQLDAEVVTVVAGDRFASHDRLSYVIDPACADHYVELLSALRNARLLPQTIMHLWSITPPEHPHESHQDVERVQTLGFRSMIFLAQALGAQDSVAPVKIKVVSNGMQHVAGEDVSCPAKATVLGPCRVVPQEYPHLACQSIDIVLPEKDGRAARNLIDWLIAESDAPPSDAVVAYRTGHRQVRKFEQVRIAASDVFPYLRAQGVYLITGGMNAIGMIAAEQLAHAVRAKLILLNGSSFPAYPRWEEWLSTHDEEDFHSIKIRKLQALQQLGTEMIILDADVTDESQMRQAIKDASTRFGAVHGVIHSADVRGRDMIHHKSSEATTRIFAPKVHAIHVLEKVLKDQELDFMMLCSSNIALLGGAGTVDYCAANAFLDAYAQYNTVQKGIPTLAIDWDQGIPDSTFETPHFENAEPSDDISAVDAAEVFKRSFNHPLFPQIVVSRQNIDDAIAKTYDRVSPSIDDLVEKVTGHTRSALKTTYVAPSNDTERQLVAIWQTVLGLESIGIHDDYFALGGDSLSAVQVVTRIRSVFTTELAVRALFQNSTVAALATRILELKKTTDAPSSHPFERVERGGHFSLSSYQKRFWFFNQLQPGSARYNKLIQVRAEDGLDAGIFKKSVNEIIRRHEILRTTFPVVEGQPMQVIAPEFILDIPVVDLSDLPADQAEAKAATLSEQEAHVNFDLAAHPAIRAFLICLPDGEYIMSVVMHHIVYDAWAMELFFREFMALYAAFAGRHASPLPELDYQYVDFSYWQSRQLQGEWLEQLLRHSTEKLADAPAVLEMPTDRPRPLVQTYNGAIRQLTLPAPLCAALYALSRQEGCTMFMTLLAAFNVLLYRYSRQDDFCVGTLNANRNRIEIEPLIGYFVNILVLRFQLDSSKLFRDVLMQTKEQVLDAQAYQELPFEYLLEQPFVKRNPSYSPLFQVMFTMENESLSGDTDEMELTDGWSWQEFDWEDDATTTYARFDLTVIVRESNKQLECTFEYNVDLFNADTIERLSQNYQALLADIVLRPEAGIVELALLPALERDRILVDWNQTSRQWNGPRTLHRLFEAQVELTPDAIAVEWEAQQLSFAQLNARANRLAHHLIKRGVGPETLVGLCIEPMLDMMTGMFAILKAGGCYVPLDPSYPRDRLLYMLQDAAPTVLITQHDFLNLFPGLPIPIHCIDTDAEDVAAESASNPQGHAHPDNLAYVIYTSGSTGKPKGTGVSHASAINFIHALVNRIYPERIEAAPLNVGLNASFAFDGSLKQMLLILYGCRIVLIPHKVRQDPEQLKHVAGRLDVLNSTPSQLRLLLGETDGKAPSPYLTIGGEAIDQALWDKLKQMQAECYNVYGPTECAAVATACRITPQLRTPVIGTPLPNVRIYVLDEYLNPVPVGLTGEIYIGGHGVARGYINRAELTAEKFLPDPFDAVCGARMYRTGDLGRYQPDGNIDYVGRRDSQVKLRGYRIELEEIEAVLGQQDQVDEVKVVMREDLHGDRMLVAYMTYEQEKPSIADLRANLQRVLPDYMIPSHMMLLDRMPLTANGKVDRSALPAPGDPGEQEGYEAPRNEKEQALVQIWSEVLKREKVGIRDSFFDLGGHSFKALVLLAAIKRRFKLTLPIATIFTHPTIAAQASLIRDQVQEPQSLLVPLHIRRDAPALFCIHTVGGHVLYYRQLAQHLGERFSVYGVQSEEAAGLPSTSAGIVATAEKYAQAIREVQPRGPYHLLGWSAGGLLAMAVAAALERLGEEVGYVGLLDVNLQSRGQADLQAQAGLTALHTMTDGELTPGDMFAILNILKKKELADFIHGDEKDFEPLLPYLKKRVNSADSDTIAFIRQQFAIIYRHFNWLADHVPDRLRAPLHLCWARDSRNRAAVRDMDWSRFTVHSNAVNIDVVEGDHYSMLQDAYVARIAQVVLNAAQKTQH